MAESFGGHRGVMAVSGKRDVKPVPRPVLIRVPVEGHYEPATVGVAELHRYVGRRQTTLQQQGRARVSQLVQV